MKLNILIINKFSEEFFNLFNDKEQLEDLIEINSFTFEKSNTLFVPKSYSSDNQHYLLVGSKSCDSASQWVKLGAIVGKSLLKDYVIDITDLTEHADIENFVFGLLISQYSFNHYKSDAKEHISISINENKYSKEVKDMISAIFWARDMVNHPSLTKSPTFFVNEVIDFIKDTEIQLTSYDQKWLKDNNFGGILGVGSGSDREPKLLIGEYNKNAEIQIAVIGKGVLFDSGGLSLKSPSGMETMKSDMAGAATAWGVIKLVAEQKLNIGVKVYTPLVENMPSGSAIRPGDVLTLRNNKTIEVLNTDAEGRLIMADALAYASEFKPTVICDIATLTGSAYVALGLDIGAFFTNSKDISKKFFESNNNSFEKFHELPLFDDYKKLIKSDIADMQNTGGRFGGAITAALLLEEFVDNTDWFHLDIAGPGRSRDIDPIYSKGGTGFGLKGMYNFIKSYL